jgi:hypothetical protein
MIFGTLIHIKKKHAARKRASLYAIMVDIGQKGLMIFVIV